MFSRCAIPESSDKFLGNTLQCTAYIEPQKLIKSFLSVFSLFFSSIMICVFRFSDLINRCWSSDVTKRPSFYDILGELHSMLNNGGSLSNFIATLSKNCNCINPRTIKSQTLSHDQNIAAPENWEE